jgi:putative protease
MIEILAPAGSPESLKAALNAGADAVYLGLGSFSARRNAKNFTAEQLNEAARICRLSGVKLFLTLNTLVYDDEIPEIRKAVQIASEASVDAFIIQDLALLSLIKEKKIHASTQMTITSIAGAEAARKLGFSRVVLARELSLKEIAEIVRSVEIETEVFIHGALCVSLSGQCLMSSFFGGRSANRGLCAQPCRLSFKAGKVENALSLKDLSVIKSIKKLEEIGVTSVKIEGRMKSPEYVSAATSACVKARAGELYDEKALKAIFSRSGFTDGYFTGEVRAMRGFRREKK